MLGTVDVRKRKRRDDLYQLCASRGSAIILDLGSYSQGIVVGVTDGLSPSGSGYGPLDWDEFSSDDYGGSPMENRRQANSAVVRRILMRRSSVRRILMRRSSQWASKLKTGRDCARSMGWKWDVRP
jgi:hypothetical protein